MSRTRRWGVVAAAAVALIGGLWLLRGGEAETSSGPTAEAVSTPRVPAAVRARPWADPQRWSRLEAARAALTPELARYELEGLVVDRDERPVAGATVQLGGPHRLAVTEADGTFVFAGLTAGDYPIEAYHRSRYGGPLLARVLPDAPPVVIRLVQGVAAEIEVVDARTRKPIAGAEVELKSVNMFPGTAHVTGVTGADGKVSFHGLTLAGHDLRVSAAGYAEVALGPHFEDRVDHTWRRRIEMQPGEEIVGRVVDEDDQPIAGARLELMPYQEGSLAVDDAAYAREFGAADPHTTRILGMGTRSKADGSFRIGVGAGVWIVAAHHERFQSAASEPVYASGGTDQHPITIVMPTGPRVAGVVVTHEDRPVPGARVEVRWRSGLLVKTVQADGTGAFAIAGLPSAPLDLIPRGEEARGRPVAVDLTRPEPDHERMILPLDLTAAITGVVVDSRDRPVAGAQVVHLELHRSSERPTVVPAALSTDEAGRFAIRGVREGIRYSVQAMRPNDGDYVVHSSGVEARAGDDVRIRIGDAGSITGRIVTDGAALPSGLVVTEGTTMSRATVERSGRFRMVNLPAATHYRLKVSGPRFADAFFGPVEVKEGEETDVGDLRVSRSREVSGVVVAAGQPIDEATVKVVVDGQHSLHARSHEDGTFHLSVPVDATLTVSASHHALGDAPPTSIAPGAPATRLTLDLQPGGTIRGTVLASGEGVPNMVVQGWAADRPRTDRPVRGAITDPSGRYVMANVEPGRYFVEVLMLPDEGTEVRVYRATVEVALGEDRRIDLDISGGYEGAEPAPKADRQEPPSYSADDH